MDPVTTTAAGNAVGMDWANLGGSLAQSGTNLLGSIISGVYNRKQQERSQKWSEEMWRKQNEYNLPINQVKRLQEAGINPNLAFGSAASAMGTSVPSVPRYSDAPDFGAAVSSGIRGYMERRFERLQVLNNIREQNANIVEKEMDNETKSLLLDDYRAMKRSEYALGHLRNLVDRSLYERNANLKTDYLSAQWLNELDKYFAHLPSAQASHYRAMDRLLEEKTASEHEDFLLKRSKGRYERSYYDRNLNPYETSTIAGVLRTIFGLGETIAQDGAGAFGLPDDFFSLSPKRWFKWNKPNSRLFGDYVLPFAILRKMFVR